MLTLTGEGLQTYKANMINRGLTFSIEMKRNESSIVVAGKKIAKLKSTSSMTSYNREQSKGILNIFASVKKSVNKHILDKNFTIPTVLKKHDSTFTNRALFDEMPIGTEFYYVDVKHCYWRIAYLNGYISEYLYLKVLENPDLKIFRNMALACIIAPRKKEYYQNGIYLCEIEEDVTLYERIYSNIRFTAWNIFGSLAFDKVGRNKTIGYYTDGIMVLKEDLAVVRSVLARNKLQSNMVKCIKKDHRIYLNTEQHQLKKF